MLSFGLMQPDRDNAAILAMNDLSAQAQRVRELLLQLSPMNANATVVLAGDRTARLAELLPDHWL